MIDQSRGKFVEKLGAAPNPPMRPSKKLGCKEKPKHWQVESLFPGMSLAQAKDKIAESSLDLIGLVLIGLDLIC